jgi:hypothetical protein
MTIDKIIEFLVSFSRAVDLNTTESLICAKVPPVCPPNQQTADWHSFDDTVEQFQTTVVIPNKWSLEFRNYDIAGLDFG